MVVDLIFRMEWANEMKLDSVKTSSEGNGRLWEAWNVLKQFHPVVYDESVRGATMFRMASLEIETRFCNSGVN